MALTVKPGKTPLVFEYDDGEVSSSVKILPEDDEGTLVRKLKRVIALAERGFADGTDAQARVVGATMGMDPNTFRQAPPVAAEPPQLGPEQVLNGWEMLGEEDLEDAPGESG